MYQLKTYFGVKENHQKHVKVEFHHFNLFDTNQNILPTKMISTQLHLKEYSFKFNSIWSFYNFGQVLNALLEYIIKIYAFVLLFSQIHMSTFAFYISSEHHGY